MTIFNGGPFTLLLLFFLIIAILIFVSRMMGFRRAQLDYQDFLRGVTNVLDKGNEAEALVICDDTPAPVARIVATAIKHRNGSARVLREAVDSQGRAEVGRLDRRLAALAIIGQIAPLTGLLGAVVGFVRVILQINAEALPSRVEVLNGAMFALVPAALGLTLAIVVAIFYGALRVRLERVVVDLEAAASQIIGYISNAKEAAKEKAK